MSRGSVLVSPLPESADTEISPGLTIKSPIEVVDHDVHGYDVHIRVTVQAGRLVADRLTVSQRPGGPPVSIDAVRNLPLAGMTREAGHLIRPSEETPDLTRETFDKAVQEGLTEATLELVAFVYRHAVALGDPPAKAVEDAFGLSRAKTGRWIAQARASGYLGPSEGPGRAAV